MRKSLASRLIILLLSAQLISSPTSAQVKNYNFIQSSTSYSTITGGLVIVPADDITSADDELYQLIDIGFDFNFNGITYNSFGISSNGFIWFGGGVPDALTYSPISNTSTNLNGVGSIEGIISPLGNDLLKRINSPFGEMMVRTSGDAPGRVCTIQFSNWSSVSGGTNTVYNFQIKLYESTNQVAFVYSGFNTDVFVNGFEVGLRGFDNSDYKVAVCNTADWSGVATSLSNTPSSIVSSAILPSEGTTFLWTPGASSLPLRLIHFNAANKGVFNKLSWSTSNESGIKEFVIEKSSNAKDYLPLGNITAVNKETGNTYSFIDNAPQEGINYYRLNIIDATGKIKIASVKAVRNFGTDKVKLYPNPANEFVTMEFTSSKASSSSIGISDANGKLVYQRSNFAVLKGGNRITIPAQHLSKGIYVVKVLLDNSLIIQRFIKQ